MRFTSEIEINCPVEKVIELVDNPKNMNKWMKGLQSFEPISGTPGHVGAKSRLTFKMGGRKIEMIETITAKNLPHEFSGTYEADGFFQRVKNSFVSLPNNRTKYISEQEFQFKGFMQVAELLMSGLFKKQSMQYLENFKNFVENT
jgi:hypothetical protein